MRVMGVGGGVGGKELGATFIINYTHDPSQPVSLDFLLLSLQVSHQVRLVMPLCELSYSYHQPLVCLIRKLNLCMSLLGLL